MVYPVGVLCWLGGYLTWWAIAWYGKRRAKVASVKEAAMWPMAFDDGPKALGEFVTRNDFAIEETRVSPIASWPPKVAVEFLTPRALFRGWLSPMQAHALSNDLLRAVSTVKRKDPEHKEAG